MPYTHANASSDCLFVSGWNKYYVSVYVHLVLGVELGDVAFTWEVRNTQVAKQDGSVGDLKRFKDCQTPPLSSV